jgi:hypothetical protein
LFLSVFISSFFPSFYTKPCVCFHLQDHKRILRVQFDFYKFVAVWIRF